MNKVIRQIIAGFTSSHVSLLEAHLGQNRENKTKEMFRLRQNYGINSQNEKTESQNYEAKS